MLMHEPGSWCNIKGATMCRAQSSAQLLHSCLPARLIREEHWHMVSASKCRWGINTATCFPRPDEVFRYFSLERGATHVFDLRPPWFIVLGVNLIYLPLVGLLMCCSVAAFRGHMRASVLFVASSCLLPGIFEIITASCLVTSRRSLSSNIDPWDSFYWCCLLAITHTKHLYIRHICLHPAHARTNEPSCISLSFPQLLFRPPLHPGPFAPSLSKAYDSPSLPFTRTIPPAITLPPSHCLPDHPSLPPLLSQRPRETTTLTLCISDISWTPVSFDLPT